MKPCHRFGFVMMLAGSALAQTGTIIQTETRVVLVDAVVTDKKGSYVSGLTEKDFRVWEDNKEQRISSFSAEASQASQKRYLVLFFDETTMAALDRSRAKAAAARLVDTFTGPDRMAAVLNFSGSFEIIQNFTNDTERLKEAINSVKSSPGGAASPAPEGSLQLTYGAGAFASRGLLLALRTLARNMMNLPGRKSLVLFTGGFPVSSLQRPELTAALDACNRANIAVYPMDLSGRDAPASSAIMPKSAELPPIAAARSHLKESGEPGSIDDEFSASSPPWRTNGQAASSRNSSLTNRQIMDMLAEGTGGFVITSASNPGPGIARIAAEQDAYYLLGYTPAAGPDRNCHSIQVKTGRAGLLVRARSGYCNAKPAALKAGGTAEQQLEARAASGTGTWAASLQAPFFYVSPGLARVNVALDVAAAPLQFEKRNGKMHAAINLLGLAYASDGSLAARFTDSLDLNLADSREVEKLKEKPLHFESQFEIAPGNYTLKLTFGSAGDAFGKLERPLSIEPFEAGQFAVSALALSKQVGRAAADSAEIEALLLQDKTPLIANDLQVVPSGSSDFQQGAPAMFYFEVYEPQLADPETKNPARVAVQIRVIDRNTGEAKSDSGLMRLESPKNPGSPFIPVALKVPMERLAPGSYLLELTAADTANNTARRTADFQVK